MTTLPVVPPAPMLAVAKEEPFDSADHLFEPKWDGIRCLALCDGKSVRLFSRNLRDITATFPEVASQPGLALTAQWIVDGELIVLGPDGTPSFDMVRNRLQLRVPSRIERASTASPAMLAAFDLLYWDKRLRYDTPFEERRKRLEHEFLGSPAALLSPVTVEFGRDLFAAVVRQGLEGIVAKARESPYLPGQRSEAWIKVRRTITGQFWIVGFVPGGRERIRSLALADQDGKGALRYAGHVGSGFTEAARRALYKEIAPDRLGKTPSGGPASGETVWTQPKLLCRVEYLERSPDGVLRHPVFKGLVHREPGREKA